MSEMGFYIDDKSVKKMIQGLDGKLQSKIMLPAMKKGVKILEKETKNAAPVRTGALRKSISSSAKRGKTADRVVAKVYVRPKKDSGKINPAKYAHLVEFGTARTAPKPFMRDSVRSASARAISTTTEEAINQINKVL